MANIYVVGKLPEYPEDVKNLKGYRGVERMYVAYPFEYYNTAHPILEFFDKYEELTDRDTYIHDLEFAKKLRDIYNESYPEYEREIIEIVFDDQQSELNGIFLGYDIADRMDSNILDIILPFSSFQCEDMQEEFQKTLCLISKKMLYQLNGNQLFEKYDDATLALNILDNIFMLFDKASRHHKFEVVKIYLVS